MRLTIQNGRVGTAIVRSVTPVIPSAKRSAPATRGKGNGRKAAGPMPQEILAQAVCQRWPEAVQEHPNAVAGRRFRLDLAFPEKRLCIEVDGWSHHGRHLADFKRDRERQNLLSLNGWRILRYPAGLIRQDLNFVLAEISTALAIS